MSKKKWDKRNIDLYDTFIFDCDGVIWLSNEAIPGSKEVLKKLISWNKNLIFVSNNSTKDASMYMDKFSKLFDLNINRNQIFTSAVSTAVYTTDIITQIKQYNNKHKIKILLIGSKGLYNTIHNELKQQKYDIEIIWTRKDIENIDTLSIKDLIEMKLDDKVCIVIAGSDDCYGYNDIAIACRYLNEIQKKHKIYLIGTNDDVMDPTPKAGVLLPAAGSLLAALQSVTNIKMEICGKPHRLLFDLIKERYPKVIDINKCLLIGDRLNTDIQFGINSGIKTALVMTGVTNDEKLKASMIKPNYVLKSITDLVELYSISSRSRL